MSFGSRTTERFARMKRAIALVVMTTIVPWPASVSGEVLPLRSPALLDSSTINAARRLDVTVEIDRRSESFLLARPRSNWNACADSLVVSGFVPSTLTAGTIVRLRIPIGTQRTNGTKVGAMLGAAVGASIALASASEYDVEVGAPIMALVALVYGVGGAFFGAILGSTVGRWVPAYQVCYQPADSGQERPDDSQ